MKKLLIVHGGAPTAVINASLYGAIAEAQKDPEVSGVFGARYGSAGILAEDFIDLTAIDKETLELLPHTPASAIGTSRTPLEAGDYERMAEILHRRGFGYVLFNGGNGSMDTCGKLGRAGEKYGIKVCGIPKTVDNDIAVVDHAPGYASAARYLAASVAEAAMDVRSLPIHVCVIEAMGRNAGWLTAASALARTGEGTAPHLIYLPEIPFDEEDFLRRVSELYKKLGGVVVVASEGLKGKDGQPIVPPIFKSGRATYYGDVSAHLAEIVIKELGIKARSEKPGLLQRCSIALQSDTDREEAIHVGREAAKAVLSGKGGLMPGLMRRSTSPYLCEAELIPVESVMLEERLFPREYIADNGVDVTESFIEWCRPLVGTLPKMARLF